MDANVGTETALNDNEARWQARLEAGEKTASLDDHGVWSRSFNDASRTRFREHMATMFDGLTPAEAYRVHVFQEGLGLEVPDPDFVACSLATVVCLATFGIELPPGDAPKISAKRCRTFTREKISIVCEHYARRGFALSPGWA